MKCVSVVAEPIIYDVWTMNPTILIEREQYPEPKDGIRVHADTRQVELPNGTPVRVNDSFFERDLPANHGMWMNRHVFIHRASLAYDDQTDCFELVPETDPVEPQMALYLDVSSGKYDRVTYEASANAVIVSCGTYRESWFTSKEEMILAILNEGDSIAAVRTRRKWLFWGEYIVHETLYYRLEDGKIRTFRIGPD